MKVTVAVLSSREMFSIAVLLEIANCMMKVLIKVFVFYPTERIEPSHISAHQSGNVVPSLYKELGNPYVIIRR